MTRNAELLMKLLETGGQNVPQDTALAYIDGIINDFSAYMGSLDDPRARGGLSNPEKALVKTFMVAIVRGKI